MRPNTRARTHLTALILALIAGVWSGMARAQDLTVFAAASLANALEDIGRLHREAGGGIVRFSFAASSTLAKQLEAGAPAGIFVSADVRWMDYAVQKKLVLPASRVVIAGNTLVLVVPASRATTVTIAPGFDLGAIIGGDGRIATGDPAHVPVGRYAQEALTRLGVWNIAERRLVRADNVRAALVLVERAEAPFGIVYATDAAASRGVALAATFPRESHPPIAYPFAIVAGRDVPAARAWLAALQTPAARAVFAKHGFPVD